VKDLLDLKRRFQISLIGEGGEYETLVLDAPFFEKKIDIVESERFWKGEYGYLLVKSARLKEKADPSASADIHGAS